MMGVSGYDVPPPRWAPPGTTDGLPPRRSPVPNVGTVPATQAPPSGNGGAGPGSPPVAVSQAPALPSFFRGISRRDLTIAGAVLAAVVVFPWLFRRG